MQDLLIPLIVLGVIVWVAYRVLRGLARSVSQLFGGTGRGAERPRVEVTYSITPRVERPAWKPGLLMASPKDCWVPAGHEREVQSLTLPDGLLYVGRGLADATGVDTEPALIDPALKVDSGHPDIAGSFMSYWPRYAEITAAARAAYLRWLAGGRKELGTCIGYVFLYFYGLERRLLVDHETLPDTSDEAVAIT